MISIMNGRVVFLLHGIGSSATSQWIETGWVDLFESSGRQVIAPDLPGHGGSPKFTDPDRYADTLAEMLSLIDGESDRDNSVDAVGFSAGGLLLTAMAAAEPARFRRIAIIGVGHRLIGGLEDDPVEFPELDHAHDVLRRLGELPGNDAPAMRAFAQGGLPRPTPADLRGISARTLLVIGDRDFTGELSPYAQFIPEVATLTIDGLDHFTAPDDRRVIRAVLDFIIH
jgi:pimeloyl-ACP methyl ester carboxylesterase